MAPLFSTIRADYAGCYRLFEGSLRTVQPVLGKYPELQKKINTGLADANLKPSMHDRAHALRKVLDEVRLTINPSLAKQIAKSQPEAKKTWRPSRMRKRPKLEMRARPQHVSRQG